MGVKRMMHAITSPNQLWHSLQEDAGLEIRRKNGALGRDADVEEALKAALGLPIGGKSLTVRLVDDASSPTPQISIEQLLVALLTSQQGYAAMMQDMLALLDLAKAKRDGQTLSMQFRFDEICDPIRITLEAFRETVERIQRVLTSRFELPPAGTLWDLQHGLQEIAKSELPSEHPVNFPTVHPSPVTEHVGLDAVFTMITELVTEFRELCGSFAATRVDAVRAVIRRYPDPREPAHDVVLKYAYAATDFWDVTVLESAHQIAKKVVNRDLDASGVIQKLDLLLAPIETRQQWVDQTYTELLDLLNLPTWRKRHELFAVWTGSVLLRTAQAEADTIHFHVADGVLSFAFGGNRLATYTLNGEQFDVWAELRSPLVGRSTKRRKGIQPDFRVLRPGLDTSHNAATRLVLECKHYLMPSVSNFSQAAIDYARSCPTATILVVNHGPINSSALMSSIDPPLQIRTQFIGDATANDERLTGRLTSAIREVLFPARTMPQGAAGADASLPSPTLPLDLGIAASICLRWDNTLRDVDLALEIHEQGGTIIRIDYLNRGDLAIPPFARLDRDNQHGPGEERIDVGAFYDARYVLIATNFTKNGEFGPEHLDCVVSLPTGTTVLSCPTCMGATEWRIATIEVNNGVVKLQSSEPITN
jgi:hypothetical protein